MAREVYFSLGARFPGPGWACGNTNGANGNEYREWSRYPSCSLYSGHSWDSRSIGGREDHSPRS